MEAGEHPTWLTTILSAHITHNQREEKHMTMKPKTSDTPSRRAMIGALAALPVASVPAIAGVAAMDDPDPIFALIEAWKRAKAKDDELYEIFCRLDDEIGPWDGVFITISDVPESIGACRPRTRRDLEELLDAWAQLRGVRRAFEAQRARVLAEFDEAKGIYDAKREASGLDAAVRLYEEQVDARMEAAR
jgi:hypothetical protein